MRFRRLKHTFLRLSTEEKVTLIGGLAVLLSSLFPWYQVNLSIEDRQVTETGFSGDLGVIGFVIFLIMLLAVLTLVGDHLGFRMPTFGYKKERVILFLTGQSTFLLLLTLAVYTKRSFDFTNAEVRFGLYTAFIGALLATFSTYALIQKFKKREVEVFFGKEEGQEAPVAPPEESEEEEERISEVQSEPEIEVTELIVEETIPEAQQMSLNEERLVEDELAEDLEFTEINDGEDTPLPAAAAEEEEKVKEEPREEPKKTPGPSLGFYDD